MECFQIQCRNFVDFMISLPVQMSKEKKNNNKIKILYVLIHYIDCFSIGNKITWPECGLKFINRKITLKYIHKHFI